MEHSDPGGAVFSVFMMFWTVFWMVVVLGSVVLWIVALVDVVRREFKEPNDKLVWVLVIALTGVLGAIIYWIMGRKQGWLPGEKQQQPGTYYPPPPPASTHPPPPQ